MARDCQLLIGGEWRTRPECAEIKSPYSSEVVGHVPWATPSDIDDALAAAAAAFRTTGNLSRARRSEILSMIADGIRDRRGDLVDTIARESGKPVKFADGEVGRAIMTFTLAAEEARRFTGEVLPMDIEPRSEGYAGLTERFPIGPITAITPFNFPLNLVAHKVAPAIATGNSIVLKPAPQAPLTAFLLAEIIQDAGAPPGMLNVVHCPVTIAEPLVTDSRVKMLTFTGSARTGRALQAKVGSRKVLLELGGNAGAIVHSDADIAWAAERAAVGGFAYAGQICIKLQRLYVHDDIYDRFLATFLDEVGKLRSGDPMDPATDIGPLIDEAAAIRVESWIDEARDGGATVLRGGKRAGSFVEPTIIADTTADMRVKCEEVFGPVVTIDRYSDFASALTAVNDSPYGLQSSVFTHDMRLAHAAFSALDVGGVIVNDYPTFRMDNYPYGGVKESGTGREGVRYAMEAMTELRTLVLNLRR